MEKQIKIPSTIDSLKEVELLIDNITADLDISKTIYGNLLISVIEAVNNAILHGNQRDPSKYVSIAFQLQDHQLIVTIEDEGEGFDYESLPDPTDIDNLENITGRGVFLMNNLSDEMYFLKQGSTVQLHFNIAP